MTAFVKAPGAAGAWRRELPAVFLLVLLPLSLYAPALLHDTRTFLPFLENADQTFAWWQKMASAWHGGYLPLWDANTLSGHPFAAELITGVFYPLQWLWLLLFEHDGAISRTAIEWFVLLHFPIAALGAYAMLRALRLDPMPALAGALAFALLGPAAARARAQADIFYGLAWLPWTVAFAARHVETGRVRDAAMTGVVLALQVVSGHIQPAFHAALAIAFMALWRWRAEGESWRAVARRILRLGVPALGPFVLIAGPQLMLTTEYAGLAYRWISSDHPITPGGLVPYRVFAHKFIVSPAEFAGVLDPWRAMPDDWNCLYLGALPLLAVLWFLGSRRARAGQEAWTRHGAWLAALLVFSMVAMLGYYSFLAALIRPLPGFSAVRSLARYAILMHLVLCAFFAMAVQALAAGARPRRWPTWLLVLAGLQLFWMAWGEEAFLSHDAALQLALAAGVLALAMLRPRARVLLAISGFGVLLAHASSMRPFARWRVDGGPPVERFMHPISVTPLLARDPGRYRVLIDDNTALPRNWPIVFGVQAKYGYGASMLRGYYDFIASDWSEGSRINDWLAMRWLLTSVPQPLALVARDPEHGLYLYERAHWYPRVFLKSQLGRAGGQIERELALAVERYDDHHAVFRLEAPTADTAVVSEIAYPGWCARVNGQVVPIGQAELEGVRTPLRTVPVEAGRNLIEFEYRPFRSRAFGC